MPSGLHRFQKTGQLQFGPFSCYRRLTHLGSAPIRDLFESALERIRKRYEWAVIGYVVMPEQVHLLVNEPSKDSLATAIQALKLSGRSPVLRRYSALTLLFTMAFTRN